MSQIALDMSGGRKLEHYGGYAYGWTARAAKRGLEPYVCAVVTTPVYAERVAREIDPSIPIVLDNGAFPAWNRGERLGWRKQVSDMNRAADLLGDRIRWVVMPDVVGNARRTWARITASLRSAHWRFERNQCLVPVQERMRLKDAARIARWYGGGLFVGGRTRRWKFRTIERLRELDDELHIHVARISSERHLSFAAAAGADSFDTTTYYYGMGSANRRDFRPRLERFCRRRDTEMSDRMKMICYYPD